MQQQPTHFPARLILLIAAVAALALAARARADAPPAGDVYIENLAYFGPGCRAGTVAHNVATDGQAFTLLFSDFVVEATPSARNANKMCELDVKMHVPNGWSFAIATADVRGFASLADQTSYGKVHAMQAFRRSVEPKLVMDQKFRGPLTHDYQLRGSAEVDALEWSPCGGSRVLRLRTRITAVVGPRSTTGSSLVTVDSLDGEVKETYAMAWKRCPGGRNDPADSGPPPDLGRSVTAECPVNLVNRQGKIQAIFEGAGVGLTEPAAKRAAQADGMRLCRQARQGRPQLECEPQLAACVISAN